MRKKFPDIERKEADLLDDLKARKNDDLKWEKGRAFSYVYYASPEITNTLKKAYQLYFSENALNPSAFPSLRKMEIEVVEMCLDLFQAPENAVGSLTSGGTESILMALKSAKEYAKIHKPEIKNPEVIFPLSAHPAFNKACDYFGLTPVIIPTQDDFTAHVPAIQEAINENTILLVASAPSYPQGVIDPIESIGQLAIKHHLLFHVDACVGGFVLPFIENFPKKWNMSCPGVTSLSADIHKYGYASKGSSVILYNNPEIRKAQFYVYTDWPGGMYASPAIMGTKPGGSIAVAWTILQLLGNKGYSNFTKLNMETTRKFQELINSTEGMEVLGQPDMCIFSFSSTKFDIYELGDELQVHGWLLDRQQNPASLHLSISPIHAEIFDEFEADFKASIQKLSRFNMDTFKKTAQLKANKLLKRILPEKQYEKLKQTALEKSDVDSPRSAAMYGLIGDLEGEGETDDLIRGFLDKLMR